MNGQSKISGKVARVLSSRELVINRGSRDGVVEGMRFAVLDPKGIDIKDPDTGQVIGSVAHPKARVQVVEVHERVAVAKTYERKESQGGTLSGISGVARLFEPRRTQWQTFRTDEAAWEEIDETKSLVKTGDPVEELVDALDESGSPASSAADAARAYEAAVMQALMEAASDHSFAVELPSSSDAGFDLLIQRGGSTFAVEAKSSIGPASEAYVRDLVSIASSGRNLAGILLVVNSLESDARFRHLRNAAIHGLPIPTKVIAWRPGDPVNKLSSALPITSESPE
jgi:hypothetical protein